MSAILQRSDRQFVYDFTDGMDLGGYTQTVAGCMEFLGLDQSQAEAAARTLRAGAQNPLNIAGAPLLAGVPTSNLPGTGAPQVLTVPTSHPCYELEGVAQVAAFSWEVKDAVGNLLDTGVVSVGGDGVSWKLEPGLTLTVTQPNTGSVSFVGGLYSTYGVGTRGAADLDAWRGRMQQVMAQPWNQSGSSATGGRNVRESLTESLDAIQEGSARFRGTPSVRR